MLCLYHCCGTLHNHVLHLRTCTVAAIYSIHVSTVLELPVDTVIMYMYVYNAIYSVLVSGWCISQCMYMYLCYATNLLFVVDRVVCTCTCMLKHAVVFCNKWLSVKVYLYMYDVAIMPQWVEPKYHCVFVSDWVIPWLYCSCLHISAIAKNLRTETCNASLMQYYLKIELVNFWLGALLSSYGIICLPRLLLPAIQSLAKNKSPTTGCLSTWQFNLYNKSDGDLNEI